MTSNFRDIDIVFHQAALPSVGRSIVDPETTNSVNISGTLNVLQCARNANVEKVVFASSSSIYGDTLELPKKESMCPCPKSPYALTKLTGEFYCRLFFDIYGLRTTSLRYFNVYGSHQDPFSQYAAVIPLFIQAIRNNKPVTIFGDGNQTRDFTYIDDVIQANIRAAISKKSDGHEINIAYGKQIKILELAKLISSIIGNECTFSYLSPRIGDIKHSLADISKAKQLLNYEPQYSIKKGLENII